VDLSTDEFIDLAYNCGFLYKYEGCGQTYTLGENTEIEFQDQLVKDIYKEYFPDLYQESATQTKTPREGRMWFALLAYCYPISPKPTSTYFKTCLEKAIRTVFDNFDLVKVAQLDEVIHHIPKNTSAGYVALRLHNARRKKEVMLNELVDEYHKMCKSFTNGEKFDNHIMFAMRGHLSDKDKVKTRPIWMISGEQIIMEMKFLRGFYQQLENNEFFKKRVIHGKGALRILRQHLSSNQGLHFCNTDISGWDAFRSTWLHERIYLELQKKIIMKPNEKVQFRRCFLDSNIYGTIAFPNGEIYHTNGGLKSGSAATLLQNTLLNMVDTYTVLNLMKMEEGIDYYDPSWLGDDFSLKTPEKFDIDTYSRLMVKYFSLVVKEEKCFFASPFKDRKFLGYEIRGGLLYKKESELFNGIIKTEHYFKISFSSVTNSFSRIFSYMILGGYNNYRFMNIFYLFLGKYGKWLDKVEYIFDDRKTRMLRILKDIYNVNISKFNSDTFKRMNIEISKYILLYDYDFINVNELLY